VALRLGLLAVLVVAAVAALPSARPQPSTTAQFLNDLRSGQVSAVRYASSSVEVRWSDGWRNWYRASLEDPLPSLPSSPDGSTATSQYGTAQIWLDNALGATGHHRLDYEVISGSDRLSWARQVPWHGLSAAAGGAALAAFLLMLSRRDHRLGNRWAWLWVMGTTTGLGVLLYLVLEPSPLWWRRSGRRPMPARPAFLGGVGLLIAVALKPAIAVLSLLVSS
jgi:hypothetical protein